MPNKGSNVLLLINRLYLKSCDNDWCCGNSKFNTTFHNLKKRQLTLGKRDMFVSLLLVSIQ